MSSSLPPPGSTGRSQSKIPPSKTPAARRLHRLTADPRYGPKLRQLPRGEQRRILDLVTANRGKQARQDLLTTYETRREARNARAREARRSKAESRAWNNLYQQLPEGRRSEIQKHLGMMDYKHLHFVQKATAEEIRQRARAQTRDEAPGDFILNDKGEYINVFWYS